MDPDPGVKSKTIPLILQKVGEKTSLRNDLFHILCFISHENTTFSAIKNSFKQCCGCGSGSALICVDLILLDPFPYWGCGSGSRGKEIDKPDF
jgi:hypothetical protein